MKNQKRQTSWEGVGKWYNKLVGVKGHYYHERIILPNVLRLLELKENDKILDLACGQGILGRNIPAKNEYLGVDMAESLIKEARSMDKSNNHSYRIGDVTGKMEARETFDKAAIILALQNFKKPFGALRNAANLLKENGKLIIVLNHPTFRIPKHSDWGVDREKRIQYRKIDSYMSSLEIPIESNPFHGKKSETTWSYHYPLSMITEMLFDNGFVIENIEEWISDKKSEGGAAAMEDKARKEIPLFMTIVCRK